MTARFPKARHESTRYYRNRLWKISYVRVTNPDGSLLRLVKFYERRAAFGQPWEVVRTVKERGPQ